MGISQLAPPTPKIKTRQSSLSEDPEATLWGDFSSEHDHIHDNLFAFSPRHLSKLLNPKSLTAFRLLGGIQGIATGLLSDVRSGLSADESTAPRYVSFNEATSPHLPTIEKESTRPPGDRQPYQDRIRIYGRNVLPPKRATPLWRLVWNAYNDTVLIILTFAAAISLALGLYETFGTEHPPGSPTPVDWVEGLAICIAILIVVLVTALNDWQKEKAFARLNAKKEEGEIKVTRSGKTVVISICDVLVGDLVHLEPGDIVPVDGIFVGGSGIKCDESSATGESDTIRKTPGDAVMKAFESDQSTEGLDPFIISGTKVLEGVGTFMATSVGVHSSFGRTMMSARADIDPTPLQEKLGRLATSIAKIGGTSAGLLFFVLLFRFVGALSGDHRTPTEKGSAFMDILIVAVTIIVVAVPEGLPLAVTLALAFATTKMLKENNLVRILRACETMGNATTICSDKTGTLVR